MCASAVGRLRFREIGHPRPSWRARDQRDGHAERGPKHARQPVEFRFERVRPGRSDDPENLGKPPGSSASRAMVRRKLFPVAA